MRKKGVVYLTGAGPGDPKLITVKGLECVRKADVVIYDWLVPKQLLDESKPGAELIYVGKTPGKHPLKQEEINALLIEKAEKGKVVTRLKGGDPFVFGRGGEEAEALAASDVPFEVVPGVTSAVAVPAYAGIPVTHRGLSSSFAVITGHEDPAKNRESNIKWDRIAAGADTLIFLMGVSNLPHIVGKLLENGCPPNMPVASISSGTSPRQHTIVGDLSTILERAAEEDLGAPAVIVVGRVVQLHGALRWFEQRPLFGKKVLITGTRERARKLSRLLTEQSAEPIELPNLQIEPISPHKGLDKAISCISDYDWAVFTSANGVEAFFSRLFALALDARALNGVKVCAIGPATGEALAKYGVQADYIPEKYTSQNIISGLRERGGSGAPILVLRCERGVKELIEGLLSLDARVDEVPLYRIVPNKEQNLLAKEALSRGEIDVVVFTAPSAVKTLAALLGDSLGPLRRAIIACIGPTTAAAVSEMGLEADIVAQEHTIPGLVHALVENKERIKREVV